MFNVPLVPLTDSHAFGVSVLQSDGEVWFDTTHPDFATLLKTVQHFVKLQSRGKFVDFVVECRGRWESDDQLALLERLGHSVKIIIEG